MTCTRTRRLLSRLTKAIVGWFSGSAVVGLRRVRICWGLSRGFYLPAEPLTHHLPIPFSCPCCLTMVSSRSLPGNAWASASWGQPRNVILAPRGRHGPLMPYVPRRLVLLLLHGEKQPPLHPLLTGPGRDALRRPRGPQGSPTSLCPQPRCGRTSPAVPVQVRL